MRYAAAVDENQPEVVKALRDVPGVSVAILSSLGNGVLDLLVGRAGVNYLIEIKDGSKPPSARKLTPAQRKFWNAWTGQKAIANNPEEALAVIGVRKVGEMDLTPDASATIAAWEADRDRRAGGEK